MKSLSYMTVILFIVISQLTFYMGACNCKQCYKLHKLNQATNDVSLFTFSGIKCYGKVVDVYDGDTFKICFYYRNKLTKINCRAVGYDSYELKPRRNIKDRATHIEKAKKAKQYLIDLLNAKNNLVYVNCHEFDKYGRVLVTIYENIFSKKSINTMMIEKGHGVLYDGGTKTLV